MNIILYVQNLYIYFSQGQEAFFPSAIKTTPLPLFCGAYLPKPNSSLQSAAIFSGFQTTVQALFVILNNCRGSSVSTVIRLGAPRPTFDSDRAGEVFCLSLLCPDRFWSSPSLLFNACWGWGLFPWGKAAGAMISLRRVLLS
jgi:hypothetical protein